MEVQLQELLDKIKNEGVKAAEAESARIREEAEKRSREILQRAEQEAADIVARAREEAARFEKTSQEAVKQAARNAILGVRQGVVGIFDAMLARGAEPGGGDCRAGQGLAREGDPFPAGPASSR